MIGYFRRIVPLALLLAIGLTVPSVARAQAPYTPSCTFDYERCLNESWDTSGIFRHMADLECGARFIACITGLFGRA